MNIKFSNYDLESFNLKTVFFCGDLATLITPKGFEPNFTQKNKIFRSSIWKDGELLSAGFPKFKNAGEDPENFPMPKDIKGCQILTKLDGSLCIVDFVNGYFNARTRGTSNFSSLDNKEDFQRCFEKYPKIKSFVKKNNYFSLLFEITSPNQRIVVDYGDEPDLVLIGCVDKDRYSLLSQDDLDHIAETMGVLRPSRHNFDTFEDLYLFCKDNESMEGFCIYFDNDQSIIKVKTEWYLQRHRLKSSLSSFKTVLDFYIGAGKPSFEEVYQLVVDTIDFEVAERCKDDLQKISKSWDRFGPLVEKIRGLIKDTEKLDRKEKAEWANKNLQSFEKTLYFAVLDEKHLESRIVTTYFKSEFPV